MLTLTVPARELWDPVKEEFINIKKETVITLEHSLVSMHKWESKWCKPFLERGVEKTREEVLDYIRCMTITQNVDKNIYYALTSENLDDVNKYINAPMTATWFSKDNSKPNSQIVTSELIYYQMFKLGIPYECRKWHLNQLITLIRVFNIQDAPQKKLSNSEILRRNKALSEARRKKYGAK